MRAETAYLLRKFLLSLPGDGEESPAGPNKPIWAPAPRLEKVAPFVIRRLSDGLYYRGLEGYTDFPREVWTSSLSLAYVVEYPWEPGPGEEHVPVRRPVGRLPKGVKSDG